MPATEIAGVAPGAAVDPVRAGDTGPAGQVRALTGFGRTAWSRAEVLHPRTTPELVASGQGPRAGLARGGGAAYGDAALNRDGRILDLGELAGVLALNPRAGRVHVLGGTSLAAVLRAVIPVGWTLPVVPGTTLATVGGAIASDVHGKNHHADGAFGAHVERLRLITPREDRWIGPGEDPEAFGATLGGMGLTGAIAEAVIRLAPLPAPTVLVDTWRTDTLDETIERLLEADAREYVIGWVDLLHSAAGRAVVTAADHAPAPADADPLTPLPAAAAVPSPRVRITRTPPVPVVRPGLNRVYNALRWHRAPCQARARPEPLAHHLFPLDAVGGWNNLYGRGGLIQYQLVVPAAAVGLLREVIDAVAAERLPVYLATVKRMGPASGAPLSFPLEGWTLALDLPGDAPAAGPLLHRLDQRVAEAGGRVYLTKDVRLGRAAFEAMYPGLDAWRETRARLDPDGVLRSDLGARLGLCAGR